MRIGPIADGERKPIGAITLRGRFTVRPVAPPTQALPMVRARLVAALRNDPEPPRYLEETPDRIVCDEVMLGVVPAPGATLGPAAIADHADRERPRYAQPRFIEIVPELPKTPTAKVQKAKLRERGVGEGTWDRVGRQTGAFG